MFCITIVIVNWYSTEFIDRLLDNLIDKAGNPGQLKVIVVDNTNGKDQSIRNITTHKIKPDLKKVDPGKLVSSYGHAFALNYAMKLIDTEYCLVVDPDIHVFKEHWDTFCVSKLDNGDCLAIGAPYPFWKTGKYHNFPSPPFCFFRTASLEQLESDWTPFSSHTIVNKLIFITRQIGRLGCIINRKRVQNSKFWRTISLMMEKVFGVFSQDTGWRIAREANEKSLKSIVFEAVFAPDKQLIDDVDQETIESITKEYELYSYEGHLTVVHKYGTGGSLWKTTHGSSTDHWLACIDKIEKLNNSGIDN